MKRKLIIIGIVLAVLAACYAVFKYLQGKAETIIVDTAREKQLAAFGEDEAAIDHFQKTQVAPLEGKYITPLPSASELPAWIQQHISTRNSLIHLYLVKNGQVHPIFSPEPSWFMAPLNQWNNLIKLQTIARSAIPKGTDFFNKVLVLDPITLPALMP